MTWTQGFGRLWALAAAGIAIAACVDASPYRPEKTGPIEPAEGARKEFVFDSSSGVVFARATGETRWNVRFWFEATVPRNATVLPVLAVFVNDWLARSTNGLLLLAANESNLEAFPFYYLIESNETHLRIRSAKVQFGGPLHAGDSFRALGLVPAQPNVTIHLSVGLPAGLSEPLAHTPSNSSLVVPSSFSQVAGESPGLETRFYPHGIFDLLVVPVPRGHPNLNHEPEYQILPVCDCAAAIFRAHEPEGIGGDRAAVAGEFRYEDQHGRLAALPFFSEGRAVEHRIFLPQTEADFRHWAPFLVTTMR